MPGKETDFYAATVSVVKVWESETWPTAFSAAPDVICFSVIDKQKSGARNVTSTGGDISCEGTDLRILLVEHNGYQGTPANTPECDSDRDQITQSKVLEAVSFNGTFSAAPRVICGYSGDTAGGKKVSHDNITTTGCDMANEIANDYNYWFAMPDGDYTA